MAADFKAAVTARLLAHAETCVLKYSCPALIRVQREPRKPRDFRDLKDFADARGPDQRVSKQPGDRTGECSGYNEFDQGRRCPSAK